MPRTYSAKKPKDMRYTLGRLLEYLGHEKFSFLLIALLVFASVSLELVGTYMIKPVVNNLLEGGGKILLLKGVVLTATIYLTAIAMAFLYTRILARSAQKVVFDIRKDLFFHMESLPLSFFDKKKHGDLMSTYTNDVDTISDAMNNSFASVIKNFIQVFGTIMLLFILNWRLSLIVLVSYFAMFSYIRYSGKRSKLYYSRQQKSLGELDGYVQEMMAGAKVVKVFHGKRRTCAFSKRRTRC